MVFGKEMAPSALRLVCHGGVWYLPAFSAAIRNYLLSYLKQILPGVRIIIANPETKGPLGDSHLGEVSHGKSSGRCFLLDQTSEPVFALTPPVIHSSCCSHEASHGGQEGAGDVPYHFSHPCKAQYYRVAFPKDIENMLAENSKSTANLTSVDSLCRVFSWAFSVSKNSFIRKLLKPSEWTDLHLS